MSARRAGVPRPARQARKHASLDCRVRGPRGLRETADWQSRSRGQGQREEDVSREEEKNVFQDLISRKNGIHFDRILEAERLPDTPHTGSLKSSAVRHALLQQTFSMFNLRRKNCTFSVVHSSAEQSRSPCGVFSNECAGEGTTKKNN